ncbi:hypothetical protein KM043_007957 [Ampulex compressa]|nr:hypothetical protein KM043_007957 [Ampulex compressa]
MFSHMILRYLTSPLSWFLINGSSNNRAIKCLSLYHRRVHKYCKNPTFLRKKSERGRMKNWFSKKASSDDVFVISKPTNCAESPDPILDPTCKVAIVIGGANGFGFAAADYLLCGGARRIVIADFDRIEGDAAVQKLCNRHGRARACFVPCDIRNAHQFEVALNQACSQYEKVHILFNDLDKQRFASHRQGDTSSPTGKVAYRLAQLSKNHAARKSPIVHVAYLNTKSATRRQNNDINSNSSDINFFGQSKYAITSQGKLSKEIQSVNII